MTNSVLFTHDDEHNLIELTRQLIRIKSFSGEEEQIIRFIEQKMIALGYDEVKIDGMGNIVGRIGSFGKKIMFDSHVDTVQVNDADEWDYPPFDAEIVDGKLYGRGAVDMKSAAAATIYAGIIAKRAGFLAVKTLYVSCTVFEEDCDGENLKHLFGELSIKPDYMIICEPSSNQIALGHKGKAQIAITTHGLSAHGSAPEKGINAVYEMAEIIQRVEALNVKLMQNPAPRGSVVASRITSASASLNAVPSECELYLDRRMVVGETKDTVQREMNTIIEGKNASWRVGTLHRQSWTGMNITYEPLHQAWMIDTKHELSQACIAAYTTTFGKPPIEFVYWDYSTNAVASVEAGIPTIGFGPGEYKQAHMKNENCALSEIVDACRFYVALIDQI